MVDSNFQQFIYGHAVIAGSVDDAPGVLAMSEQIDPDYARDVIQNIPLSPLPLNDIEQSRAIAYLRFNGHHELGCVLALAHFQNAQQGLAVSQLVLLPDDMETGRYDFDALLQLIKEPIPISQINSEPLAPLHLDTISSENSDKKVAVIKSVLDDLLAGDFRLMVGILALAIGQSVVISNFPQDNTQRLALIRGLRLLLPSATRYRLTFTTHTDKLNDSLPCISFSDSVDDGTHYILNWNAPQIDEDVYTHPYIDFLLSTWDNNVIALVEVIAHCDTIAEVLIQETLGLEAVLSAVAMRYQMDMAALRGDRIASDVIFEVLDSGIPLSAPLQTAYLILLLENTFEDRDAGTSRLIGALLDDDQTLDLNLSPFFNSSTEKQPDAVYSFIRAYLQGLDDSVAISERWLQRLHDAADASVQVAIGSADATTIQSWLTLLSREPLRYELGDILGNAMLSARPYIEGSPDLAQELLVVAVKRQPDMLDDLLADEAFLDALPEDIASALIDYDPVAIEAIGAESMQLFLLVLQRAIEAGQPAVTSASARMVWQIHTRQKNGALPPQFQALSLIERLADKPECLINGAYATLLSLILSDGQDALFYALVPSFADKEQFAENLASILEQSERGMVDMLQILPTLCADDYLSAQTVANTLSVLLINRNWSEDSYPLVEQLARLMTGYPDTGATMGVLWKLSELAARHKNEQMLKVSMRRLLDGTGNLLSENLVVESIQTIRKDSNWSATGRSVLVKWWRHYVHEQGMGQLQKIEKLLEGKRNLDDLRAIVQTVIAMRRIIGKRTLEEFSDAVTTTYNLLQALSEGFDTGEKMVDSTTIRNEIDAREDELPQELRPVLSTNLKELAQLVTSLSENRSKPSLIRSDESVERQLAKGEQEPQSAIDVMRWLSGYLEGIQKDGEVE